MSALTEASGVSVSFGKNRALADVTLEVPAGEVTAVVGGDGAGKSTLLRLFANDVAADSGMLRTLPAERLGYQPATSGVWRNLTVDENIEFVGASYGMSRAAIRTRAADLLGRAGLAEARKTTGAALSGGMRQKLGFVLAMLHEPELVLLDEPSTGVDPVSRVELWRLIAEAAAAGSAVLLATTYLDEAQRARTVLALDQGRTVAFGDPQRIIDSLPGTIQLVGHDADPGTTWRRGVRRHSWVPQGSPALGEPIAQPDLEDALIALTLQDRAHPTRRSMREDAADLDEPVAPSKLSKGTVVASAANLVRRFGSNVAVDDVSLDVKSGEIVGLIGANGSGKTTFLRALIGLDRPDEGTAALFGSPPDAASRRRIGYVPQGLGLYQTLSVDENVRFFSEVYGVPKADLNASLAAVRRSAVGSIGLGRQRQLAFDLALSHDPELLVLDEPTSGVDPLARARLWDRIHEQAAAGRGVIITTHYLQEAEQCSRLALLSNGRLLGTGSVDDLTAGTTAVLVVADEWQRAFAALGEAGLPTMLSGRDIRVAGVPAETVRAALGGIAASVEDVPPTLEETMVLREASVPVVA